MTIPVKYDPLQTEAKWYKFWLEKKYFKSVPDSREPFTIVIPPPNVTGVLHMGHILNNTIQDIFIRRARMQGKNALWVPGTDHASIATEAKVVALLKSKGIEKKDITREEFLKYAWEWKNKHGDIIIEQLKKLGCSCDWDRLKFTMDKDMYDAVINVFIDLYNKGQIYRGVRMVNWDSKALTAVSDEEVYYKEITSKLYYVRYRIENTENEWITIATTRPETILGDTAICVNPEDTRYKHLKGKFALLPLLNRRLPIIFDEYVDRTFGSGALKVTPAHDINDYNLGIKHKLESIDIFNIDGTLNANATLFVGEDRFEARKKMIYLLEEKDFMVKIEDIINNIGYSERTHEVIEPKLSMQWFVKMEKLGMPAIDKVLDETIQFYPPKFVNTYKHWFENIRDWCISRQLWWGQQIPVYYLPDGSYVVAKSKEEALVIAKDKCKNQNLKLEDLRQDEDVLDTWFSSWLWPISTLDGINNPDNKDIKYYYPTDILVTAPDILFFWVARMIMAGYEYRKDMPFHSVYLTGMVRDLQRRKMSKSLGNSPDPIDLMNHYGADGTRVGMLFSSPAGNDLLFEQSLCEQGRNFCNKIWNAFRLIKGWEIDENLTQPEYCKTSVEWFNAKLNSTLEILEDHFTKYRVSDALMAVYKLIWDDYCSWYLEMIKPAYQHPIDKLTYTQTVEIYEKILKVLHPFMPFITEEIWHLITERDENDCIIISKYPEPEKYDLNIINRFEIAEKVIIEIRNFRKEQNIPQKEPLHLSIKLNNNEVADTLFDNLIFKLCNLAEINYVDEKPNTSHSFIVKSTEYYFPLAENINVEGQILKLEEELRYAKGFLDSVLKKLNNERFINNANTTVIDMERKKQLDAISKIELLEQQILQLRNS